MSDSKWCCTCDREKGYQERIAELEAEREQRAAEWSVMARACGNWRTWGKVEECPHTHPDWKVAARAIIERDAAFNKGMERAAEIIATTGITTSANTVQVIEITRQYVKAIRKEIDT